MATQCSPGLFDFERVEGRRVVAAFDGGRVTSDAGALLLGATDRAIGSGRAAGRLLSRRPPRQPGGAFAADADWPAGVRHRAGVRGPGRPRRAALRSGAGGVGRETGGDRADCAPLAGKSTLNPLEHAPQEAATRYHRIGHDGAAIERLFVDLFLAAHATPPREIVLDLDATDDPLHGQQEGRFFHGYYDCYCYLPLYVFCGRHLLAARLRRSKIDASAGAVEEVGRIVGHIRESWPRVRIVLRGDSGFARERLMAWCEDNRVDYVFGLARNARLEMRLEAALDEARRIGQATGKRSRVFRDALYLSGEAGRDLRQRVHADHAGGSDVRPDEGDRSFSPWTAGRARTSIR